MDVRVEAAPMEARALCPEALATVVLLNDSGTFSVTESVASLSCPSIAGHSISAVAPDYFHDWRLARAA